MCNSFPSCAVAIEFRGIGVAWRIVVDSVFLKPIMCACPAIGRSVPVGVGKGWEGGERGWTYSWRQTVEMVSQQGSMVSFDLLYAGGSRGEGGETHTLKRKFRRTNGACLRRQLVD